MFAGSLQLMVIGRAKFGEEDETGDVEALHSHVAGYLFCGHFRMQIRSTTSRLAKRLRQRRKWLCDPCSELSCLVHWGETGFASDWMPTTTYVSP